MFEGQPKGLYALALANTGERFGYYTMLAVFVYFLQDNFGWSATAAGNVYSNFLAFVYFLPFIGGILADKFGYSKMVTIGILVMFLGYGALSFPAGNGDFAMWLMFGAIGLICIGTGLFKGNLQVMVGNLYESPEMQGKRDSAFSLFYMAINIGALFAPTAAIKAMEYAQNTLGYSKADSYHFAFGVACVSLIISIAIYYACRSWYGQTTKVAPKTAAVQKSTEATSGATDKERIIALCLVFAVVIFFWMSFHQNGLTFNFFARDYTATSASGPMTLAFNVWNLVAIIIAVYASFSIFQSAKKETKAISAVVTVAALSFLGWQYSGSLSATEDIAPAIFQQFNAFFVVALTPVSMAVFSSLAKKGKEPSAPRKIGIGMLIAAIGFGVLLYGSLGLATPDEQTAAIAAGQEVTRISPSWLINTYLILTFAELLLSPMGISFVSKVAPAKYKGMMMGGWFVSTAIGNYLTNVGSYLWNDKPLWLVWSIFIACCLVSALFVFSILKKLERIAK